MATSNRQDNPDRLILAVDDNPENLKLLVQLLKGEGHAVRSAIDGDIALAAAQKIKPDLILLDILMPTMNGFETCRRLKVLPETRDIPIIFLSALSAVEDIADAFEAGAVDYVTKPFNDVEVLARVKTHLHLKQLQRRLEDRNLQLTQEVEERRRAEAALDEANRRLLAANKQLERLSRMDELTQVANRRHFDEYLETEWKRLARNKVTLGLILMDIDYFKKYNDTYGHQAGDDCLRQVAHSIRKSVRRPADLVARYGGEEFAVVLPDTDPQGAYSLGEAIRQAVVELGLENTASDVSPFVSLSLGVVSAVPDLASQPDRLIKTADQALYRAKKQGRNQVVLDS